MSFFQSRDEVPGGNDSDASVLTEVEQVSGIAGYEVIRSSTDCCREKFVIIDIAACLHVGQIDHELCNLP